MEMIVGSLLGGVISIVLFALLTTALFRWQARKKPQVEIPYKPLFIVQLKALAGAFAVGVPVQIVALAMSGNAQGHSNWGFLSGIVAWYFLTPFFYLKASENALPKLESPAVKSILWRVIVYSFLTMVLIGILIGSILKVLG